MVLKLQSNIAMHLFTTKKTTPFGILKAVQQHQPLITLMSKRTGMQVNFQFQQLWMFLAILNLCGIYTNIYS